MSCPGFRGHQVKSHRFVTRTPADLDTPNSDGTTSDCRIPRYTHDLLPRLVPRVIRLVMDQFILERAEEALGNSIVIAVALPAHTRNHTETHELPLIGHAVYCVPWSE